MAREGLRHMRILSTQGSQSVLEEPKILFFGLSQRGSSKNNLDEENTEDMSPMFNEQHIFTFS